MNERGKGNNIAYAFIKLAPEQSAEESAIWASMFDAKTNLSKYVSMVESGQKEKVVIMRNKVPVAQLTAYEPTPPAFTIGLAEKKFTIGTMQI